MFGAQAKGHHAQRQSAEKKDMRLTHRNQHVPFPQPNTTPKATHNATMAGKQGKAT